ncbi:MAG: zinc permease [Actinobacteria bacterium]|jgi:ZIP family zinc transporter|nr:MAG: zinc permease [Actinomycetota bacterium]
MSTAQLLVLGALAGFTIFFGLPIGRIKSASPALKAALSAMATGILLFLLWDVLVHGIEPVEEALTSATDEGGSWLDFVQLAVTFAACATIGLMSLVYYDRWFSRQRGKAMLGPGAASAVEFDRSWVAGLSPAAWLALLIATGIGLHNFSEGLAIGQSAAQDQVTLALVLIIGFGLHNATEGFGIVAPLSGSETRPSWKFLALLGLIGGGPTFVGTLLGQTWVNETVSVAFLALAAGSILYVVIQLMNVNQKLGYKTLVAWMLLAGLFLGFATDFIIEAAGV